MNKTPLLVSIGLNVLAVGVIAAILNRDPAAGPVAEMNDGRAAASVTIEKKRTAPTAEPEIVTEKFHWSSIESDDFEEYIAKMREIGVPEETIRDIIYTDVGKIYGAKLRPFSYISTRDRKDYWKYQQPYSGQSLEQRKEYGRLRKEQDAVLKSLLGEDYREQMANDGTFRLSTSYDYVAKDKREALKKLLSRYSEQERELYAEAGSSSNMMKEDQSKLKAIQAAKNEELATLLTPEELFALNIRTSRTASSLRYGLAAFEPTQREFDEIFKVQHAFDQEHGGTTSTMRMSDKERRDYYEKKRALDTQISEVLGEERFADYKKASDYKYKEIYKLTDRYDLGKATADEVWEIKAMAEQKASELRRDTDLKYTERNEALERLKTETRNAVRDSLGEKAYENFTGYAASWVDRLAPTSITSARPPTVSSTSKRTTRSPATSKQKQIELLERMLKRLKEQVGQ